MLPHLYSTRLWFSLDGMPNVAFSVLCDFGCANKYFYKSLSLAETGSLCKKFQMGSGIGHVGLTRIEQVLGKHKVNCMTLLMA